MDNLKKWLPTGLLAIAGILALSLGFAAAFATKDGGSVSDYKTLLDGKITATPAFSKILDETSIMSHIDMAYIGGIVTGVLGLLAIGAAGFVVLVTLGIAAIVCHSQLMSPTWSKEQVKDAILTLATH